MLRQKATFASEIHDSFWRLTRYDRLFPFLRRIRLLFYPLLASALFLILPEPSVTNCGPLLVRRPNTFSFSDWFWFDPPLVHAFPRSPHPRSAVLLSTRFLRFQKRLLSLSVVQFPGSTRYRSCDFIFLPEFAQRAFSDQFFWVPAPPKWSPRMALDFMTLPSGNGGPPPRDETGPSPEGTRSGQD